MPARPGESGLGWHLRRTLVLAWPMMLARVGIVTMHTMDVIVLGRAGAGPLSDYVLGQAIQDSLIAMVFGLMMGVPVLVARETGAGNDRAAGAIWRRGLVFGAAMGLAITAVLQFTPALFLLTGQDAAIAARAGAVARILAFSMPFVAVFYVSAAFLEALQRPMVGLVAILFGNVLNLGLNVALVFGAGPLPALGARGCALATVTTFALLALLLLLYLRFLLPGRRRYGIGLPAPEKAPRVAEQARIGLASGGSFLFESSAFTVMTIFVGWLGALALAAHGVLFQFLALIFMVAAGLAGATQVRVGNAWGRGDPAGVAMAGWAGLGLASLFTGAAALAVALAPDFFLGIFTSDREVVAGAAPVLVWVLLATLFDGGQAVMNHACRGRGDTWVPTTLHFGSYWMVMVPGAWLLAFPAGQGLAGIYQGILIASVVSILVLSLRFRRLSGSAP
ncbi:MAG TPA: MATE family efflux transporter [Amaricoccus sp.]|uniref:MATE family efflux transporter n=1 Tax=Amaricoccus sp. TaxID=1872485 RepID=UPI001DFC534C|nr:MATE family efflux transporter [Amaricoccus sp.]MCB1373434.1 MATE family efflux transporter [Paracoccaceae bacterium]MCB1401611.1 MATE family efflux transporter [Paracoccaceae bacterium]HPG21231.1 MATE family efflux transporter [Amaricoccus sp.]HRW13913.1 MATE family efflux transporter [Amaricoccus sp.]